MAGHESLELRHRCCEIRKIEPLKRALTGKKAWVTGLREVPGARDKVPQTQFDATYGLVKFNPLAQWTDQDVWNYVNVHDLPYHPLHDRGYESIGCAPCTLPGNGREGRWAGQDKTECGLHV